MAAAIALFLTPATVTAQSGANVALIVNDDSPDSRTIGERYARARAVPENNIIHVNTPVAEEITRPAYLATIETPIRLALSRRSLQDRILYIVLTKGVPLRIAGTAGLEGTIASVDSELTLLYRRMTGALVPDRGRVANPYFLPSTASKIEEAQAFSRTRHDIYLVTRLDGFSTDDALALIERGEAAVAKGKFVLDRRGSVTTNLVGEAWLAQAGRILTALKYKDAIVEETRAAARDFRDVLGYYSWGSNDPANRQRQTGMTFLPGAIAATFAGPDARTLQAPPDDWRPTGNWQDRTAWFAGAPTSLIGDVVREGATGVAGHVADPFLHSAVRPDILFPSYVRGFNLAEAFYLSIPHLSWQTVVIGDPLVRPFPPQSAGPEDDAAIDPESELPAHFSKRRIQQLQMRNKTASLQALALVARSEVRITKGDKPGAREALEQAAALAPEVTDVHLQLGLLYEENHDYSLAHEQYEQVLKAQPENAIVLNNLAYHLAVREKKPAEAKPLAEKAVRSAPGQPSIVDTLAWIEYLLGNYTTAARHIASAVKAAPKLAEARLHAAFIYAALEKRETALAELKAAIAAAPELAAREDVQELEAKLSKGGGVH